MEKPTRVMLNIRINKKAAGKLRDAGIRFIPRSRKRDQGIEAKHVAEAELLGRDAYRGNRTDATGVKRSDSGVPVYGWDPQGNKNLTMAMVTDDIENNLGYRLVDVHLTQKPKDRMFSLRMSYNCEGETFEIPKAAAPTIDFATKRTYEFVHAFRNPNGSMTINPSHAHQNEPEHLKVLRIRKDGSLRSEWVD